MENFIEKVVEVIKPVFLIGGFNIILILIVIFAVNRFGTSFIDKIVRRIIKPDSFSSKEAERKRENTLIRVFSNILKVTTWTMGVMMLLSEVGIDIGPVIAAAGIFGVALGFGGQALVKDTIAGLFIILENQYRVGDEVELVGVKGVVEDINLRVTIIRDIEGVVHYIPNGSLKKSANMSQGFSRVYMKIGVPYEADISKVEKIINSTGEKMSQKEDWKDLVVSAPKFVRIEEFSGSAVKVMILGETKPQRQYEVAGELRLLLKEAFAKEDINIS